MVEFSYSVKYGYREPYEIHKILLEKISILHYLIESQTEEQKELYYPYYINEFASVVDDTIDVLSLFFELV